MANKTEMDLQTIDEANYLLEQQKRLDKAARELYINTINVKGGLNLHMRAPTHAVKLSNGCQLLGVNVGQRLDEATLIVSNEYSILDDEVYAIKLPAKDLLAIARLAALGQLPDADELAKAAIRQLRYDLNLQATTLPEYVQCENDACSVIQRVDFRDMTAVIAVYPSADSSNEDEPVKLYTVLLDTLTPRNRDAVAKLVNAFGGYRSMQTNGQWIDNNADEV